MFEYYADQHLHTSFSGDSETPPEDQINRAVSLGIKHICITDHHDHDVVSNIDFELDIPKYMTEMKRLKAEYSDKIDISTGIELGLQNHISEYLYKLTDNYDFDLVIGSIHFIDGLDPYYPEYFEMHGKHSYERYFEVMYSRIKNIKCYDVLGHLDYITRYGRDHGLTYSYRQYADYIDEILRLIISGGKALECNTGVLAKGYDEPNPSFDVFRRYKELGGELITFGSDAHTPEPLGVGFESCGEMLKSIGFGYYAVYRHRNPAMEHL